MDLRQRGISPVQEGGYPAIERPGLIATLMRRVCEAKERRQLEQDLLCAFRIAGEDNPARLLRESAVRPGLLMEVAGFFALLSRRNLYGRTVRRRRRK
ncbi:MAG: hypothetical protein E5X26_05510 [Mesorhizobium sp.]|nr:MAG: hypothetical protein E5X26_05510 [Mesorhizobium sp.]TIT87036.1 MAG: hypothetical protein E5W41_06110 [Mesorhizobium sp.]TKB45046.1 MAG: hypothetical protein E5V67_00710 [Mesorhizobium sp.]